MNDLINLLKQYAPQLATAAGGPLAGLVVTQIAQKLGAEATPSAVTSAIQADPQVALKLAEIDIKQFEIDQDNVTKRWQADMASDSWLSKNIRPMALIAIFASYVLFAMMSAFGYNAKESYVQLLGQWGIIIFGAYFTSRGAEKIFESMKK